MKLYIPSLGDDLKLTQDWVFTMKSRNINHSLIEYVYGPTPWWNCQEPVESDTIRINKGAVLRVDCIYIRKGPKDYHSITFRILKTKEKAGCRFLVPLSVANTIEFELR